MKNILKRSVDTITLIRIKPITRHGTELNTKFQHTIIFGPNPPSAILIFMLAATVWLLQ